ncbi:MAG: MMPL family transporter [Paludibacteraceae bacterium]|nr:MMPL family transporter [Paludibacteraceae bacterium]
MTDFILKIFTFFSTHRFWLWTVWAMLTMMLLFQVFRLNYKEDISDFLPAENRHQEAMRIFQDISGSDRIFILFKVIDDQVDPDSVLCAMDYFGKCLAEKDTAQEVKNFTTQIDTEKFTETLDFVYQNIPLFLSENDYRRMDSLLSDEDFVATQLMQDKQMLMFPVGGVLSGNIQRDPLNLFTPVVSRLQTNQNALNYELYDGHIFSPDMQCAVAILTSPFGASETNNNRRLLDVLDECAAQTQSVYPFVSVSATGGPVIAVGNAQQIKKDSVLAIGISLVLILLLLFLAFGNAKNLLLISFSVAWGWLFAIGGLSLVNNEVSVIVIGISSVIIGIAVNYPLHLVAHLNHTPNVRLALREIVTPLVVGNVTTVAAFVALVPLQSVALRDLGVFASFLLVGTILFVIVCLPHLVTEKTVKQKSVLLNRMAGFSIDTKRWIVLPIIILTCVFAYFSVSVKFDSNISHINYMSAEQKSDMQYLQKMISVSDDEKVYVVSADSSLDGALDRNLSMEAAFSRMQENGQVNGYMSCSNFIVSEKEQLMRIGRWNDFVNKYAETIRSELPKESEKQGFAPQSFNEFFELLETEYKAHPIDYFRPLSESVFAGNFSVDEQSGVYNVVTVLNVPAGHVSSVEQQIGMTDSVFAFDIKSINSAMADSLTDEFNYIGWVCGLVVFLFLWLSLGHIELAIISFLPMVVGWVWILGIMSLLGIQFNIVNVILATFIFGQGDDYTIFMTEGVIYEYAYRKKMLASYKYSIIISALIMFIGIGALIVAKHPALHSLAEVTIVGMFTVVLMAYVFPPFVFRWLVMKNGVYRKRPLSFSLLGDMIFRKKRTGEKAADYRSQVLDRYRYKGVEIEMPARKLIRKYKCFAQWVDKPITGQNVVIANCGQGEFALFMALVHSDKEIYVFEKDENLLCIATHCFEYLHNIHVFDSSEINVTNSSLFVLFPTDEDFNKYENAEFVF